MPWWGAFLIVTVLIGAAIIGNRTLGFLPTFAIATIIGSFGWIVLYRVQGRDRTPFR